MLRPRCGVACSRSNSGIGLSSSDSRAVLPLLQRRLSTYPHETVLRDDV